MNHYEERLTRDLERIREELVALGADVRNSLNQAVTALRTGDADLAYKTVIHDQVINRGVEALDKRCHAFVARHLPSAGHLRFVSSVLRLNLGMERIGDYAVSICREAVRLSNPLPAKVLSDLDLLADRALTLLGRALEALETSNADLARSAKGSGVKISTLYDQAAENLVVAGEQGNQPVPDLFAYLVIFGRLGRACDQAKNICEEVVFSVTGEVKAPKVFRILFVEEVPSCLGMMATAYARSRYPGRAAFHYAGVKGDAEPAPECLQFLRQAGYATKELQPAPWDPSPEGLLRFHVLVNLRKERLTELGPFPYRVVVLNWSIPSYPELVGSGKRSEEAWEIVHRKLAFEVENLMRVLIGEGTGQDGE